MRTLQPDFVIWYMNCFVNFLVLQKCALFNKNTFLLSLNATLSFFNNEGSNVERLGRQVNFVGFIGSAGRVLIRWSRKYPGRRREKNGQVCLPTRDCFLAKANRDFGQRGSGGTCVRKLKGMDLTFHLFSFTLAVPELGKSAWYYWESRKKFSWSILCH